MYVPSINIVTGKVDDFKENISSFVFSVYQGGYAIAFVYLTVNRIERGMYFEWISIKL